MSVTHNPSILVAEHSNIKYPVQVNGGWRGEEVSVPKSHLETDLAGLTPRPSKQPCSFPFVTDTVLLFIQSHSSHGKDLISVTYIFVLTWGRVTVTWNETIDSIILGLYQKYVPLNYSKGRVIQKNSRHQSWTLKTVFTS